MEYLKSTLSAASESIQSYLPNRLLGGNTDRASSVSGARKEHQTSSPADSLDRDGGAAWDRASSAVKEDPEKQEKEKQPTETPLIEAGQTARSSFKQYVLDIQDHWQTKLFPLYTKEGVSEKELKAVHARIENAIQWFRSHPNPHQVDVLREKNVFIEDIEQLKKRIDNVVKESNELAAKKENESFASSEGKSKKVKKGSATYSAKHATPYEVFWKALSDTMALAFRLLFIYFVLRLASISANDVIYKGILYRLHAFFYTSVLFIYTIPYHIFRFIMHWFKKWDQPYIIESAIPLKEVNEPITNIFYSIYRWYRNPVLAQLIPLLKERETEMRRDVLKKGSSDPSAPPTPATPAPTPATPTPATPAPATPTSTPTPATPAPATAAPTPTPATPTPTPTPATPATPTPATSAAAMYALEKGGENGGGENNPMPVQNNSQPVQNNPKQVGKNKNSDPK
jgi:hypothetical protein